MRFMQATTTPVRALKLKAAARSISVSDITMRRLIARGLIKPIRSIRHVLIPISEIERFLHEGDDSHRIG